MHSNHHHNVSNVAPLLLMTSFANVSVPTPVDPVYFVVEIACALVSVVENSLVIFLFARNRNLRTAKNCYVISLASADLLVGLIGIPSALTVSVGLPRDFHACLLVTSSLLLLCTASIMSLVAVTVDRFYAIAMPFAYATSMTSTRAKVYISVAWIVATAVGALPSLGWNRGRPPDPRCFFTEVTDPRYLVFIYVATIIAPSFVMAVFYAIIYRTVKQQGNELSELLSKDEDGQLRQTQQHLQRQLELEAKAAKSIAIVVVVFVVSWLPLYTVNTVSYMCPDCVLSDGLVKFTIVLSHSNSVWNPILYALTMKDFRSSLRKFFFPSSVEATHLLTTK